MHTGPAIERNGDWFGAAVNLAARVGALADDGQVLLTDATRNAAGALAAVRLEDLGERTLRHVREPVRILAARRSTSSVLDLAVDPVCHMLLDTHQAATSRLQDGRRLHFCSSFCAERFAARSETTPDQHPAR